MKHVRLQDDGRRSPRSFANSAATSRSRRAARVKRLSGTRSSRAADDWLAPMPARGASARRRVHHAGSARGAAMAPMVAVENAVVVVPRVDGFGAWFLLRRQADTRGVRRGGGGRIAHASTAAAPARWGVSRPRPVLATRAGIVVVVGMDGDPVRERTNAAAHSLRSDDVRPYHRDAERFRRFDMSGSEALPATPPMPSSMERLPRCMDVAGMPMPWCRSNSRDVRGEGFSLMELRFAGNIWGGHEDSVLSRATCFRQCLAEVASDGLARGPASLGRPAEFSSMH